MRATVGALAVLVVALFVGVGFATNGAATAAETEYAVYCLNGVATTFPAPVLFTSDEQGTHVGSMPEWLAIEIIDDGGGVFYTGWHAGSIEDPGWYYLYGEDPADFLEPGFAVNSVSRGACAVTAPPVSHVAVCKMLKRGDGTMGLFQEISVAQWNDKEGQYFDAPAANWVDGVGLTCDNPTALGYKAAGYNVAWGGKKDPNHDPNGVRGSGFNDIYPYFVK